MSLFFPNIFRFARQVAGWGEDVSDSPSAVLLEVELPVVPNAECRVVTTHITGQVNVALTGNMFCAGFDHTTAQEGEISSCYAITKWLFVP